MRVPLYYLLNFVQREAELPYGGGVGEELPDAS
jgi:hypothetical protein